MRKPLLSKRQLISLASLLIIFVSLPLAVFLVQQKQRYASEATESTSLPYQISIMGVNYGHYSFINCSMEDTGIIANYHQPGVRETVQNQLAAMRNDWEQYGRIRSIRLMIWFMTDIGSHNWGVIPSAGGIISEPYRTNLINFLQDIKNAEFDRLNVSYSPQWDNDPAHEDFNNSKLTENWNFIAATRELIKQYGPADTRIDLYNEGAPSIHEGNDIFNRKKDYIKNLYANYVSTFGKEDVTISFIPPSSSGGATDRLSNLINILNETGSGLSSWFEIHPYNSPYEDLKQSHQVLQDYNLPHHLVIGETYYNDQQRAEEIQRFMNEYPNRIIDELIEWHLNSDSTCPTPPYSVKIYWETLGQPPSSEELALIYASSNLSGWQIDPECNPGGGSGCPCSDSDVALNIHPTYGEVISNANKKNTWVNAIANKKFHNSFLDGSEIGLDRVRYKIRVKLPTIPKADTSQQQNPQVVHVMAQLYDGINKFGRGSKISLEAIVYWQLNPWIQGGKEGRIYVYTTDLRLYDTGLRIAPDTNWHEIILEADFLNEKYISVAVDGEKANLNVSLLRSVRSTWEDNVVSIITAESMASWPESDCRYIFYWNTYFRNAEFYKKAAALFPTPTPTPTGTVTPTPTSTAIPTPTPTGTPTPTPTPTLIPTPTPTPTQAPNTANLNFQIKFQGITQPRPDKTVKITLKKGDDIFKVFEYVGVSANSDGIYSGKIWNTFPDTYNVYIKGWAHLQKRFEGITLAEEENSQDFSGTNLVTGDINGDNRINAIDIGIVIDDYWPNTPPDSPADLNLDGKVNAIDIGLVIENYFLEGD